MKELFLKKYKGIPVWAFCLLAIIVIVIAFFILGSNGNTYTNIEYTGYSYTLNKDGTYTHTYFSDEKHNVTGTYSFNGTGDAILFTGTDEDGKEQTAQYDYCGYFFGKEYFEIPESNIYDNGKRFEIEVTPGVSDKLSGLVSITYKFSLDGTYTMRSNVLGSVDKEQGTYKVSGNVIKMTGKKETSNMGTLDETHVFYFWNNKVYETVYKR